MDGGACPGWAASSACQSRRALLGGDPGQLHAEFGEFLAGAEVPGGSFFLALDGDRGEGVHGGRSGVRNG